jgi:hypothetical protein
MIHLQSDKLLNIIGIKRNLHSWIFHFTKKRGYPMATSFSIYY